MWEIRTKTTIEDLKVGRVIPVAINCYLVWGEIMANTGEIFYYNGPSSNPIRASFWSIAKSNKSVFHTSDDENFEADIPEEEFTDIECDDLRIALAEWITDYTGGRVRFGSPHSPNEFSYTDSEKFKDFMASEKYCSYKKMFNDSDFKENGINSAVFKAYEEKYMLPNCEKQAAEHDSDVTSHGINSLSASGSDDGSVEARSVGTQVGPVLAHSIETQTNQ